MTTSRSDRSLFSLRARRALMAAVAAVALAPLLASATGGPDDTGYKIKPADSNLWSQRFRGGRLIGGGGCERRCIAFTFDDGPNWETTPALLDTLDRRGIRATFFVTGHRLDGDGEVARRNREVLATEWRHGHLVGNHTYHHDLLDTMTEATLRFEIDRTEALIQGVLGERVWLFRAPYGALHHPRAVGAVFSRGYTPVFWAMDSSDWRVNTAEGVLANVRAELDRAPRGGVLLMHDTLPWSVAAFPLILDEIAARNAAFVARGEEPYEVVGLERFYEPLRAAPARTRRRR
ncbi:MAG: polysaccharide deacetylase family protein [Deltaproteobacteria bacterium]|nr:polysaccharide deacetylase family protein [Deltaproteobacteria bacterium]